MKLRANQGQIRGNWTPNIFVYLCLSHHTCGIHTNHWIRSWYKHALSDPVLCFSRLPRFICAKRLRKTFDEACSELSLVEKRQKTLKQNSTFVLGSQKMKIAEVKRSQTCLVIHLIWHYFSDHDSLQYIVFTFFQKLLKCVRVSNSHLRRGSTCAPGGLSPPALGWEIQMIQNQPTVDQSEPPQHIKSFS